MTLVSTAGEGRGEAGGDRHHAEAGVQNLPAAVCTVRHAERVAKGRPRRSQHRVNIQILLLF